MFKKIANHHHRPRSRCRCRSHLSDNHCRSRKRLARRRRHCRRHCCRCHHRPPPWHVPVTHPRYVAPPPAYYPAPAPVVTYRPAPWTPAWYNYCHSKYRSFNPNTGYFLAYSGQYKFLPLSSSRVPEPVHRLPPNNDNATQPAQMRHKKCPPASPCKVSSQPCREFLFCAGDAPGCAHDGFKLVQKAGPVGLGERRAAFRGFHRFPSDAC